MSLSVGVTYTFQIIATNAIGTALIGTTTAVIPFSAPGAPGTGLATAGTAAQTAVITFRQGLTNGNRITQYNYSTAGTGGPWTPVRTIGTAAAGANTNVTVSVGTLAYGPYTFNLQAQNTAGTGLPGTNTYGPVTLYATVTTLAGGVGLGTTDGFGTNAKFNRPIGVAVHPTTGVVYVADSNNHRIRMIATDNYVTTLAGGVGLGTTDGFGTNAKFNRPTGVAVHPTTGVVYVADQTNQRIRMIGTDKYVRTLAGNGTIGTANGTNAQFSNPSGVAVHPTTGVVYVADTYNHRIRAIGTDKNVTTFAGGAQGFADGIGSNAQFKYPGGVTLHPTTGVLYVSDEANNIIRAIDINGNVTTLAGEGTLGSADGFGTNARFYNPNGVAVNPTRGVIYISEPYPDRIRMIDTNVNVTTLAGGISGFADGEGTNARFYNPLGVAVNPTTGVVYVGDSDNNMIRMIQ